MYILPLYCQWVHSPGENKQQIHINCVFKSISKLISCYGYLITNTSFHISQCIQVSLELIVQILLGLTGLDAEELGLSFFGILDRYFSFSCTCKKLYSIQQNLCPHQSQLQRITVNITKKSTWPPYIKLQRSTDVYSMCPVYYNTNLRIL